MSASSAVAKWLISPTSRDGPAATAAQSSRASASVTPSRPIPESNFTWTRAPRRRASSTNGADQTTTSAPAATARPSSAPVIGPKIMIGASRPAARSSSASVAVATPSQDEPAARAARAAGTAP